MSFSQGGKGNGQLATATDVAIDSPSNGEVLGYNASLAKWENQPAGNGPGGGAQALELVFSVSGDIAVFGTAPVTSTSKLRLPPSSAGWTLKYVSAEVNTAPAGQDIIININKSGVALFSSAKPTITAGTIFSGLVAAPANTVFAGTTAGQSTGDVLTFTIEQYGTTTAGSDLVVTCIFEGIAD